jgi:hypothetical protein
LAGSEHVSATAKTIVSARFLGDALEMSAEDWIQTNACFLREAWRSLLDDAASLGLDGPSECDYLEWTLNQYDTQCGIDTYCRNTP